MRVDRLVVALSPQRLNFSSGKSGEMLEWQAVSNLRRFAPVDLVNARQREVFLAFAWRSNMTQDGIACLQSETLHLSIGDIDIIGRRKVIIVAGTKEPIAIGHDFEHAIGRYDVGEIIVGSPGAGVC